MDKLILGLLVCACLGCGHLASGNLSPIDGQTHPELERPSASCRYLSIWVDYSHDATGLTPKDLKLNESIAHLMERELTRLGHRISEDPQLAYWSLTIMGAHTGYRDQFVFTAMLSLRNLEEAYGSGLVGYSNPDESVPPTMYTGLTYGSRRELGRLVRSYVRAADTALLPLTRRLCDVEAADQSRELDLEEQIPGFMYEG
jgi:hypothetical protein